MEYLVAILIVALVAAGAVIAGQVRRLRELTHDRSASAQAIAEATGRPVHSLRSGIRRLTAQREVAEQREVMIRTAVEQAAAEIAVLDPELRVLFATPRTMQMLEGRHGDAAAVSRIRDLAKQVLATGETANARVEVYVPSRRVLSVRADRLPPDVVDGVSIEVRDISEEERVDAMRQDFVANVSHELKTPIGALTVLAEAMGETDDDVARKRLSDRLVGEAERVAALVDDILDLSLVERDQPDKATVDLVEVIGEACRSLAVVAERWLVRIEADLPSQAVVVFGDRRQLLSAIANLLDNAIKYGSVPGESSSHVVVRLRCDESHAVLTVEDHGIGISEPHLSRIFERFYRVDRARGRSRGGTGLGLAIVRHVALNHGGTISAESTPGVGTVFRLRIPRAGS